MPDLMQHRLADLRDQALSIPTHRLDRILKNIDRIGDRARILDTSPRQGPALVEAQEQFALGHIQSFQLPDGGPIDDLNGHLVEKLAKLRWKLGQRQFHQFGELSFTHSAGHGYNPPRNPPPVHGCTGNGSSHAPGHSSMISFPSLVRSLFTFTLMFLGGCGVSSFLITPVSSSSTLEETTVQAGSGFLPPKVVIIEVEGMLANSRSGGLLQPQENKLSLFTQQMDKAAADPAVKAVVLRINSPGGTVTCSDTMYQMVKKFRQTTRKPIIADTQEVTASGAYYVACGCDKIIAHPTSVVGSIGVIFQTFEVSGAMAKLGITSNAVASGPYKEMGSPFKKLEPDERALMQQMVDEYYARFLTVVTTNRHIDSANLKEATDGRVFSGEKAAEIGLVDQVGLLDDAIAVAKDMGNAPSAQVVMYKRPYGYSGSIYSSDSIQPPRSDVMKLEIPAADDLMPTGFYYLWQP